MYKTNVYISNKYVWKTSLSNRKKRIREHHVINNLKPDLFTENIILYMLQKLKTWFKLNFIFVQDTALKLITKILLTFIKK